MKNNNEVISSPMNWSFAFMVVGCAIAIAWTFNGMASCSMRENNNYKEIRLKQIEKELPTP